MESAINPERIIEKEFEAVLQRMQRTNVAEFTDMGENVSKIDFFKWVVERKNFLLHGSNNQNILELEPRLANCSSKEFGNMKAVYAVADPVLPTFFAIKDIDKFRGVARSGVTEVTENGRPLRREYDFAVSKNMTDEIPWSAGAVYILPKETFVQGHDDEGNLIDEWASSVPVKPIGKIEITPSDFPFLQDIKEL